MDELQQYLKERKKLKGYLFIPYLALGDPDWQTNLQLAKTLLDAGADSLELGLPFSDPSADGPVLQRAFKRVLARPFHWADALNFMAQLKEYAPDRRFVVMGYANVFYQPGFKNTFAKLYEHNVRGVVIPDVPFEEKHHLIEDEKLASFNDKIAWVDFITPTTTPQRLLKIAQASRGFLYIVSYKGTTGGSSFSLKPLAPMLKKLRQLTTTPLIVGFGIRKREQAAEATRLADGFIIGSRLHEVIEENLNSPQQTAMALQKELQALLPAV